MNKKNMRKKVIISLMIQLSIVSTFVLVIPTAYSPSADPIIAVNPSGDSTGVADADSIEWALQNVAYGGTVQFSEGHYYVSRTIFIEGFTGALKGAGKDQTIIEAVRKSELPGEGFAPVTNPYTSDIRYTLFWFWDTVDFLNIEDMTLKVLHPNPCDKYIHPYMGETTAIIPLILTQAGTYDRLLKNVRLKGADGDGGPNQKNVGVGCVRWGYGGEGDSIVENCDVENFGLFGIEFWECDNSHARVTDNTFTNMITAISFNTMRNMNLVASYNKMHDSGGIFVYQRMDETCPLSTYQLEHNDIHMKLDSMYAGIEIWDPHIEKTVEVIVSYNTIYSEDTFPYGPIFMRGVHDAVVANNMIRGYGPSAIYVGGPWAGPPIANVESATLIGNNLQRWETTAYPVDDPWFPPISPIWLGPVSSDCTVIGGAGRHNVADDGINNIIVGLNNMGNTDLSQDIKDAMQQRIEAKLSMKNQP